MGAVRLVAWLLCVGLMQDPDQLFRDAVRQQQQGDWAGAAAVYERLLRLRPDFVAARSNLGVVLGRLGRFDEAIANYRLALQQDPENAGVRLNLALAHYKQSEFEPAAQELERVRRLQPGSDQALYLVADCYLRLGDNKKVIELLGPLAQARASDLSLAYLLGTALIRDGQVEAGQVMVDRILARGDSAEAGLLVGATQFQAGQYERAIASIGQAIQRKPDLPGGWALLGLAQEKTGDWDRAREAFRKALDLDPNDFDAALHLGGLLYKERELETAGALTRRAIRIRPASAAAHYQLGVVNVAAGKLSEAAVALETAVKGSPDWIEPHVQLAALYYRLDREAEGERERRIVVRLSAERRERELKSLAR